MKEAELSAPVSEWLRQQGYAVYSELPIHSHPVDLIGRRHDEIIAVELKTALTEHLIRQANISKLATENVYCAVPTNPRKTSIQQCAKLGLGILRVVDDVVTVLLKPTPKYFVYEHTKQETLRRCDHHPQDGIGGMPNIKGVGPAQDVAGRVNAYLREHPKATWREMYENIPNHYCSYGSMCGAMKHFCIRRESDEPERACE